MKLAEVKFASFVLGNQICQSIQIKLRRLEIIQTYFIQSSHLIEEFLLEFVRLVEEI